VGQLPRLHFDETPPGRQRRIAGFGVVSVQVPHAHNPRFPTVAWWITGHRRRLVYASDVAEFTDDLRTLTLGADLLVIDGAMYGRSIFTHLRIDHAVPEICQWPVERILLTQIICCSDRDAPRSPPWWNGPRGGSWRHPKPSPSGWSIVSFLKVATSRPRTNSPPPS
jgi:hypothetical protein